MTTKKIIPKLFETFGEIDIYRTDVTLLLGPYELLADWVRKNVKAERQPEFFKHDEKPGNDVEGLTWCFAGGGTIIWMPLYSDVVLVHEAVHVAHHVLLSKGIHLLSEGGSTETYAYLTEYIFRKLRLQSLKR